MNTLALGTLVVTGFVSCAEFGSYAFVHPVLRSLPARERILVEQGLLRTFGRVMPVAMPLCVVLAVLLASTGGPGGGFSWAAVAAFALAVVFTVAVNVPINLATGRWDAEHPPADWQRTRGRWEFFQGVRSWLLLAGFVLVGVAATV